MSSMDIPLQRCICIHSQLQFIDTAIQNILLHHGLLPVPLALVDENNIAELRKTLNGLDAVRIELREIFRSCRRRKIVRMMIHIGSTPFRPTNVYELPIHICEDDDSSHEKCGDCCQELSDNEKRSLNRRFFVSFPASQSTSLSQRMFLFLQSTDEIVGENIEECELDVTSSVDKRSLIRLCHSNCERSLGNSEMNTKWMRVVPFIVGSK